MKMPAIVVGDRAAVAVYRAADGRQVVPQGCRSHETACRCLLTNACCARGQSCKCSLGVALCQG